MLFFCDFAIGTWQGGRCNGMEMGAILPGSKLAGWSQNIPSGCSKTHKMMSGPALRSASVASSVLRCKGAFLGILWRTSMAGAFAIHHVLFKNGWLNWIAIVGYDCDDDYKDPQHFGYSFWKNIKTNGFWGMQNLYCTKDWLCELAAKCVTAMPRIWVQLDTSTENGHCLENLVCPSARFY